MFFDPRTRLYDGDDTPRSTPYRPDGSLPRSTTNAQGSHLRPVTEDILHIQPRLAVRGSLIGFGEEYGIVRWKLCRCENIWGPEVAMKDHVCQESSVEARVLANPVTLITVRFQAQARNPTVDERSSMKTPEATKGKNYARLATGNGDGDQSAVKILDFAKFIADGHNATPFTGTLIRDFAGLKGSETVAVHYQLKTLGI